MTYLGKNGSRGGGSGRGQAGDGTLVESGRFCSRSRWVQASRGIRRWGCGRTGRICRMIRLKHPKCCGRS